MPPPVVLTIAGSDNSAGAGAQADLKTFTALGAYGLTAITCVVAEVPGKVSAIHPVPALVVAEQIRLSLAAFPVAAVKTGLLCSAEIVETVCNLLEGTTMPLVVDPVMIATSGDRLLRPEGVELYRSRLFHRAMLVTPNMDEAAVLTGMPVHTLDEMRNAGANLIAQFGCAWLLKGGHLTGDEAVDLLFHTDGKVSEFRSPRVPDVSTHGTGCTTSAAIAAGLARGLGLDAAVAQAKRFVTAAIRHHHRWGDIHALNHGATSAD
ncbi:MAG: bifunctional hydroxymethylpyrimidine kinase/phosphomethylpyrimidine kinase [Chthoniobacteraceae bacterium]|jgi:hydroxymethylpyrimidine/phosphomethylpyrimidine kinase